MVHGNAHVFPTLFPVSPPPPPGTVLRYDGTPAVYSESQSPPISAKSNTTPARDKLTLQLDSGKAQTRLRTRHRSSVDVSDSGEQDDIDSGIDSHVEPGAANPVYVMELDPIARSDLSRMLARVLQLFP
uniref:Uncharacterized protein n=1 Tax=Anopheles farauti TaxID=69004 RepID=A0A182Q7R2_9DIPT